MQYKTYQVMQAALRILRLWFIPSCFTLFILLLTSVSAFAQAEYLYVETISSDIYINPDGTIDLDYLLTITQYNDGSQAEFIDLGLPNDKFILDKITATINGEPIKDISISPETSSSIRLNFGSQAIKPGETAEIAVKVPGILNGLQWKYHGFLQEDLDASFDFRTPQFAQRTTSNNAEISVTFHLPSGLKSDQITAENLTQGVFPAEHAAGSDQQGNDTISWKKDKLKPTRFYLFKISFPVDSVIGGNWEEIVPTPKVNAPRVSVTAPQQPGWNFYYGDIILVGVLAAGGYLLYRGFGWMINRSAQKQASKTILPGEEEYQNYHAGTNFAKERSRSGCIVVWFALAMFGGAALCAYLTWYEFNWVSIIIGALIGAVIAERFMAFRHA